MPTPLKALALDGYAEMDQAGHGSLAVGGKDKVVRVVNYDTAEVTHLGLGHCSPVTTVAISPELDVMVSGTESGAMFIWRYPA